MKRTVRTTVVVVSGMVAFLGNSFAEDTERSIVEQLSEALGTVRVDFPEPEGGMALQDFARQLGKLCNETRGNRELPFIVEKRDENQVIELERRNGEETVGDLLKRVGIGTTFTDSGTVLLRPSPVDPKLAALLDEVVVEKFSLDDTEVTAAIGYVLRLYAKEKGDQGKKFEFRAIDDGKSRRLTINLSRIPLGQALKYMADLGSVRLAYEPDSGVVTMEETERR